MTPEDLEGQYRLLFDGHPSPMWVFDIETLQFLAVNEAALRHYGYTREEMMSLKVIDLRPESARGVFLTYQQQHRHAQVGSIEPAGLWRHKKKDGTLIDVEISSARLPFAGRDAKLVLAQDVTARLKAEEEARHAQKMDSLGRLAAGIAHDFNNLLTGIIGFAVSVREELQSEGLQSDVDEILGAARRAASLTQQLLAFSRKQVLDPKILDINSSVREMGRLITRVIGEDVQLELHLEEPLFKSKVDPGQLEQVIVNLAVNARDAMPDGGKLTIETKNLTVDDDVALGRGRQLPPGEYVVLAVSDTGIGMDKAVLDRVFEPFFTTKPAGKGTGLGLATVFGIVRQSGGYVWPYSEPGKGTTFRIYFPRAGEVEEEALTKNAGDGPPCTETILVAEDDALVRRSVMRTLKSRGFSVLQAASFDEAVAIAKQESGPIDLLLTDLVMPHGSGAELAKAITKLRPQIHVLFMSGFSAEAGVHRDVLAEGADFIEKPLTSTTLVQKIRSMLDR